MITDDALAIGASIIIEQGFYQRPDPGQISDHGGEQVYAKQHARPFSKLCVADKLAIALTPAWLYLPLVKLSGEIHEYMALAQSRNLAGEPKFEATPKYLSMGLSTDNEARWYAQVQEYVRRWVEVHKEGAVDTWTPNLKPKNKEDPDGIPKQSP